MERLLTIVLAGGQGQRLHPLTQERSKPAVTFGGKYRIIDFTLSNCINSGMRKILVLTQYRSDSLNQHVQDGWGISSAGLGDYIYCVPPQQKTGQEWYRGTADALRQNLNLIKEKSFDNILVLSGDHIYKMDYRQMLGYHRRKKAILTLSAIRVKKEQAAGTFGVIEIDKRYRLIGFEEKPNDPKTITDTPEYSFASMGIYIFNVHTLLDILANSGDDFGKQIVPEIAKMNDVFVYDYETENSIEDFVVQIANGTRERILVDKTKDSTYWRDVGSIESYYDANIDLINIEPAFNLYGEKWPFRTCQRNIPPSKLILGGIAQESIISEGCIISGGLVRRSILSPSVIVERDAIVDETIIFDNAILEPLVRVRRAIIDKSVIIKSGATIGWDLEADKRRGCTISDSGIVVVPKEAVINPA
jgi:glucose-1-phosphate adenylyltransferase